jgi:hypothetical protein
MTRSYRRRAITEPIAIVVRPRPAVIDSKDFTCFRLVRTHDDGLVPMELSYSSNRMFAFVPRHG